MGYYLQVGLKEAQPLASISGMGDLLRWIEGLKEAPLLKHLAEYGVTNDPAGLEAELTASLADTPPSREDVRSTVENLAAMVKARDTDALVVTTTDGMVEDDGSDD